MSVGGMRTLYVTTAGKVAVGPFGRHVAGLTAQDLHTEYGARASRRGGQRKVGKRYSSDPTGDGPSAREQRKRARNHLQEHECLYQADGSLCTEEEQVALAMALSETDGSPSSAPTPAPASTPIPAPPPAPHVSLLVTITAQSVLVHAPEATTALAPSTEAAPADGSPGRSIDVSASILSVAPDDDGVVPEGVTSNDKPSDETALGEPLSFRTGDSPGVEVVPGPQRLVAEPANIADDHPDSGVADGDPETCEVVIDGNEDADVSGGSSDDHDEVVDSSDVEAVGGADAELRFPAPTPSSAPPLQRGRLRWPRATQRTWHDDANRQYASENWHADANRKYDAEMSQRRRRPSSGNNSNSSSTQRRCCSLIALARPSPKICAGHAHRQTHQ